MQYHLLHPRKILGHMQHDFRFCSTEPVNGLIIVPHQKQVIFRKGKQLDNIILQLIDILELIDQDVSELFLPGCQNVGMFLK